MDILSEIVKVVVLAVSSLGGIGLIKFLFFMKPERRMKNIEADEKELNVMKSLVGSLQKRIEQQDEKIKELNDRLDKLYAEKHEQERENNALIRENNELKLALKEAEHNICVRPDDECFKGRLPKRTYCSLKKLAAGDYDAFYEDNKETDNKDENEDN
jgi:peptidoglycan hydrolase CwlO-like protein